MNKTLFRTRIKFCGLTRPGDVRLASELGADAIGFVFAQGSPRRIEPEQARAMRNALAPLVNVVALFADTPAAEVREAIKHAKPTLLQFHGDEDDAFCRGFGVPWIKAIAMGDGGIEGAAALQARYPNAAAFLFDGHACGGSGGQGARYDLKRIPTGLDKPFIVAGGLEPDNVFDAIQATLPWGVDVSSGIESVPGIKDGEKMRRFVEEVRRADCHLDEDDNGTSCAACGR
jgi:phosphoribosylanthranilate isomerase